MSPVNIFGLKISIQVIPVFMACDLFCSFSSVLEYLQFVNIFLEITFLKLDGVFKSGIINAE